jgi:hypothetical protein
MLQGRKKSSLNQTLPGTTPMFEGQQPANPEVTA